MLFNEELASELVAGCLVVAELVISKGSDALTNAAACTVEGSSPAKCRALKAEI